MAANSPKPPGNFFEQLHNLSSSTKTNNNNNLKNFDKTNNSTISKLNKEGNSHCERSIFIPTHEESCENPINGIDLASQLTAGTCTTISTSDQTPKSNCNCTNISIMHLFHEMKQEFPTIPDTAVAQCVNKNCHQRENCIQELKNEFFLNPIPVQTFPAKVLHRSQKQQSVPKALTLNKTNSITPVRPAPTIPSIQNRCIKDLSEEQLNYDSISSATNRDDVLLCNHNNDNKFNEIPNQCLVGKPSSIEKVIDGASENSTQNQTKRSIYSGTPTAMETLSLNNDGGDGSTKCRMIENHKNLSLSSRNELLPPLPIVPLKRPTTLNLQHNEHQKEVNIQLQKQFQQKNQSKVMRQAPLPPKPIQIQNDRSHSSIFHNGNKINYNYNTTNINQNSNVNNTDDRTLSQRNSFSIDSNLSSPTTSSGGESGKSPNVALSQCAPVYQPFASLMLSNILKSPKPHRSVVTLHPEPPYTKDFMNAQTTSVNPTVGTSGQKSFTSVNLTLRQPNNNPPASTIDISAGPGLSGINSGLTYSSTSYDARRGYQQNFHITVTDQGGVFSSSHIRPRSCHYPDGEGELDGHSSPLCGSDINSLGADSSGRCMATGNQRQVQLQHRNIAASDNNNQMCASSEINDLTENFELQKNRRDMLATALRDNKRRLLHANEEIQVLTEPTPAGVAEGLEDEIQRLRCDCETILNEIDAVIRCAVPSLPNCYNVTNDSSNRHLQPFPHQQHHQNLSSSSIASSSGAPPRQPQLDFIENQNNTNAILNSPYQGQGPPIYQQYCQQNQKVQNTPSADNKDYIDPPTDTDEDEDEDEEPWVCNMCTFHNHPQLNICECCENVRILPGTVRIMPRESIINNISPNVTASTTPTSPINNNNNASSLQNDTNLTQQQLQQFALHT